MKKRIKGHFTGNIVIRRIKEGQLDRFEIIDGQQRITTFQIIFCVIRDICLAQVYQELADEATRHVMNTDDVVRRNNLEEFPYKFLPTDYDKSAFKAVVEGEYGNVDSHISVVGKKVNNNILEA